MLEYVIPCERVTVSLNLTDITYNVQATVQQRNLPNNSQRRYNIMAVLPGGGVGPAVVGLPQVGSAQLLRLNRAVGCSMLPCGT